MTLWLSLVCLVSGAPPGFLDSSATPREGAAEPRAVAVAQDPVLPASFDELVAEYEDQVVIYKRAHRRLRGEEKRAHESEHPIFEFWPRFETRAGAGEPRALLWLGDNAEDLTPGLAQRDEVRRAKLKWFGALVREHAAAACLGDAVERIAAQRRYLERGERLALLEALLAVESLEVGAAARRQVFEILTDEDATQEERVRAEGLEGELLGKYADTEAGRAFALVVEQRRFAPGAVAPDFTTTDVDGTQFRLSDYRGKVVVLDFWGFW